jgi:anti-sigma factor RsiW
MTRDDLEGPDPGGPDAERRLSAYLDDQMSPAEARDFLAWLEAHPDALRAAEEHRRVWSLLGAYRDEAVPEGFAERVLARVGVPAASTGDAAPVLRLVRGVRRWRALAALETVPEALLEGDAIARLATLSDDEFEALLEADPQDLPADAGRTGPRGG